MRNIYFIMGNCISSFGNAFSAINKTGQGMGSVATVSACLGFLSVFVIGAFRRIVLTSAVSTKGKMQREKDKREGISRYGSLIHVGGLRAPENCKATAALSPTDFTINCAGREYILKIEKIKYIDVQAEVNESQYLQRSFVKGIAGQQHMEQPVQ
ncbi:hypothetical protein D5274_03235 [bacterium 1XD42-94]|nr:hypothetical protein [bacterium 1XD42-76]NBK04197.1 hypothetical protein [bacterium 1XD42-94]